jgi:hypothetical protein
MTTDLELEDAFLEQMHRNDRAAAEAAYTEKLFGRPPQKRGRKSKDAYQQFVARFKHLRDHKEPATALLAECAKVVFGEVTKKTTEAARQALGKRIKG